MYCLVCLNILFLFVQKVETWDKRYQYLLFAAEPYEIIGFKVIYLAELLGHLMHWPIYIINTVLCRRYQAQRSINQQINSSLIGILTRRSTW